METSKPDVAAPPKAPDVQVTSKDVTVSEPPKDVTYASVIKTFAAKYTRGNVDKAGKAVRAKVRGMGQEFVENNWPQFKASGKLLKDGDRYPTVMPRAFAVIILTRSVRVSVEDAEVLDI
jgi:hypothetical protein